MNLITEQFSQHRKEFTYIGWGIVVIIVCVALWYVVVNKKTEYEAVFLSNNQVYFGNLTDMDDRYAKLTDVFYLQTQAVGVNQQLQIVKLGTELHTPKDIIYLNREHILMVEKLTDTSQVVQFIENYHKAQAN